MPWKVFTLSLALTNFGGKLANDQFIAPKDATYEKIVSNIQEVKARGGNVIALVSHGDKDVAKMADYVIEIPETDPIFTSALNIIPLQLLAYQVAKLRECNIDQPRNLAKSVTVE
jgi:glucosamine--fructose-6-phosphate aminotransferase (isomerizing)